MKEQYGNRSYHEITYLPCAALSHVFMMFKEWPPKGSAWVPVEKQHFVSLGCFPSGYMYYLKPAAELIKQEADTTPLPFVEFITLNLIVSVAILTVVVSAQA